MSKLSKVLRALQQSHAVLAELDDAGVIPQGSHMKIVDELLTSSQRLISSLNDSSRTKIRKPTSKSKS